MTTVDVGYYHIMTVTQLHDNKSTTLMWSLLLTTIVSNSYEPYTYVSRDYYMWQCTKHTICTHGKVKILWIILLHNMDNLIDSLKMLSCGDVLLSE